MDRHRIAHLTECTWWSNYIEETKRKSELESNEYRAFNYTVSKHIKAYQECEGEHWVIQQDSKIANGKHRGCTTFQQCKRRIFNSTSSWDQNSASDQPLDQLHVPHLSTVLLIKNFVSDITVEWHALSVCCLVKLYCFQDTVALSCLYFAWSRFTQPEFQESYNWVTPHLKLNSVDYFCSLSCDSGQKV